MTSFHLIITANGTRVRAFSKHQSDPDSPDATLHLKELTLSESDGHPAAATHARFDKVGRFEKGNPLDRPQGYAAGEQHQAEVEFTKRQAKAVAESISAIVEEQGSPSWLLVAPSTWLHPVEADLSAAAKSALTKRQTGDWTGMSQADIETRILSQ